MGLIDDTKSFIRACVDTLEQRSFTAAYNKTFDLVQALSPDDLGKAHRLRHKVYCEEHRFECPAEKGSYLEQDKYDDRSVHYYLSHKVSGETVGTLRVILPNDERPGESFPIQEHCDHPLLQQDARALTLCEISRFCMAPRFRKRPNDGKFLSTYHDPDEVETQKNGRVALVRRRITYPQAALLRGAFETALHARIMDCVWMVEPRHLWSLNRIGFPYRVLGPHVKIHGGLQPVIFNIKHVLDTMRRKEPSCWEIVSDSGRLQEMADELARNDWHDGLIDDCWDNLYEKLNF